MNEEPTCDSGAHRETPCAGQRDEEGEERDDIEVQEQVCEGHRQAGGDRSVEVPRDRAIGVFGQRAAEAFGDPAKVRRRVHVLPPRALR